MKMFVIEHKNCGFVHNIQAETPEEALKGLDKNYWSIIDQYEHN